MPRFIRQRDIKRGKRYEAFYEFIGTNGHGYSFPCDEKGVVPPLEGVLGQQYYRCVLMLQSNKAKLKIIDFETKEVIPAIIECDYCKEPVVLNSYWANPCKCGCEYDSNGSVLALRRFWGDENSGNF